MELTECIIVSKQRMSECFGGSTGLGKRGYSSVKTPKPERQRLTLALPIQALTRRMGAAAQTVGQVYLCCGQIISASDH